MTTKSKLSVEDTLTMLSAEFPNERWAKCTDPVLEGRWFVSDAGRVWSAPRSKILEPSVRVGGSETSKQYTAIRAGTGKERKTLYVHRLVATAFVERPSPDHREVTHIDTNASNNKASNLEWVTSKERMKRRSPLRRVLMKRNGTEDTLVLMYDCIDLFQRLKDKDPQLASAAYNAMAP